VGIKFDDLVHKNLLKSGSGLMIRGWTSDGLGENRPAEPPRLYVQASAPALQYVDFF
jgi:hypothetical protein